MIDPRRDIRGRGATSNPTGRFESRQLEPFDDGWGEDESNDEGLPSEPLRLTTQVFPEKTRTAITRNDSPDISFDRSINPYKGCEHGCIYCASGDTAVLMADGITRLLGDLQKGDEIYGTTRVGWYRRYTRATVLDHWETRKPAYRVTLEDGTSMVASADHRFLTARGWKFVMNNPAGIARAHLTTNDKLLGVGAFASSPRVDADYQRGYLTGLVRGDGHVGTYVYDGQRRARDRHHVFRLALADLEALDRADGYLRNFGIATRRFLFQAERPLRRAMQAIGTRAAEAVENVRRLIALPSSPSLSYDVGFLAGIFDAEGSYSQGTLRISNTDASLIDVTVRALRRLGLASCVETQRRTQGKPIQVVRVLGGIRQHLRFFQGVDTAIARKRDIAGAAVKNSAPLRVVAIEPTRTMQLFDITTSTGDFVADGVIHHNCFARPTHSYVGLSPGIDFETKIFSKPDAPAKLREELAKPSYKCAPITLGANTDPYQPIERELKISRQILEVLRDHGHPVSIITKSALVQRDIDILSAMASEGLAQVFVSVTTLSRDLARIMEPRAATPDRRLETIEALNQAGVPASVLAAPMIPFINDSELERILEAAHARGARRAGYVLLRLPHELKELIEGWLDRHFPERKDHVLNTVRNTRGGNLYDSRWGIRQTGTGAYAQALSARFLASTRRLGLNQNAPGGQEDRNTLVSHKFHVPEKPGQQLKLL